MTQEQREWLQSRIHALKSKQKRVGIFRASGIQRTIDGMRAQLDTNEWKPHD